MSSEYHVLCVSHDPALVLEGCWQTPEPALAAVKNRAGDEHLAAHVGCDLLVGRYSYPLIEVCCPPVTDLHQHYPFHPREGMWMRAEWLRLALAAHEARAEGPLAENPVAQALAKLPGCWAYQRLDRLRVVLGMPGDQP